MSIRNVPQGEQTDPKGYHRVDSHLVGISRYLCRYTTPRGIRRSSIHATSQDEGYFMFCPLGSPRTAGPVRYMTSHKSEICD